jgi:hypothetical protein
MNNPINHYLNQLQTNLNRGNATEHTHRIALQTLIESLAPQMDAVNEPKRIECGSPDLVISEKKTPDVPLGYIEAKDIGVSLDNVLKTPQLKRYLESLNNLILTDYLEFRWFVEGEYQPEMSVRLAKLSKYTEKTGQLQPVPASFDAFKRLIDIFIQTQVVTLRNPQDLAKRMAKIARLIYETIFKAYQTETEKQGALHNQLESFRQILLDTLTVEV